MTLADKEGILAQPLRPDTPFVGDPTPTWHNVTVLDFWQWSASSLLNNTMRGVLAEFIVARASGCVQEVANDWESYDLETPAGIKVEVKSAAYVQVWHRGNSPPSRIVFGVRPTLAWDAQTGEYDESRRRHADVYVFCLLAEKDCTRVNPLDLSQWQFFPVRRASLDERFPDQKSLSLAGVTELCSGPVDVQGLTDYFAKLTSIR